MKHILLITVLFLCGRQVTFAQIKELSLPKRITTYDTNKGISFLQEDSKQSNKFKIRKLTVDTSFDEFYRIEFRQQMIEVWRVDSNYFGQVINYTSAVHKKLRGQEYRKLLFSKAPLKSKISKKIFNELIKINSIPDMDDIKGWSMGFDGESCSIERASKLNYSIRSYWDPMSKGDSIQYKPTIAHTIDLVFNKWNMRKYFDAFFDKLPQGTYTDGFTFTIKSMEAMPLFPNRH